MNQLQTPSFNVANRPFGQSGKPSLFDGCFIMEEWFIEPYYRVVYNDGEIEIYSNSHRQKGRKLKRQICPSGYYRHKLLNKYHKDHQIIADRFIGKKPKGLTVNHKDGDKLNNRPENLEYLTIAENIRHAIENGLHISCTPEKMPKYKDGRTKDINAYKLAWYHRNKERLKNR